MNAPDSKPTETLWTAEDTARYLRVSKCWVYRRVESGELPHGRIGGCLRFSPSRICEYAAAHMATGEGGARVIALASRRPPSAKKGRR
jgi:excisionase family DNA binding protein